MIELAMEIPTTALPDLNCFTDLDFALAHHILADPADVDFYASRQAGRTLILDNSMHELGEPMSHRKLLEAVTLCKADYLVAPDMLGRPVQNLEWYRDTARAAEGKVKMAVVMCGRSPNERAQYLRTVQSADMLCLPFREDRLGWFLEQENAMRRFKHIHLLGVNEIDELKAFVRISQTGKTRWSVDTAKPLKWAAAGMRLETMYAAGRSLRGAELSSHDLLSMTVEPKVLELTIENTNYLRSLLA